MSERLAVMATLAGNRPSHAAMDHPCREAYGLAITSKEREKVRIRTKYFELVVLTRRERTRQMIIENGKLGAIKSYMKHYKTSLGDAMKYVRETAERMQVDREMES